MAADQDYRRALGATIHELRTARRWSLRMLSQASDISVPYLSEIERGRKDPSGAMLAQLADAFDMSLGALLSAVAVALDGREAPESAGARRALWDAVRHCDDDEIAELSRYARYLLWRRTADADEGPVTGPKAGR